MNNAAPWGTHGTLYESLIGRGTLEGGGAMALELRARLRALADWVEGELGIPAERQVWHEGKTGQEIS